MKDLWFSGRELALDFASTLFFLGLYALTRNLALSVGLGIALAALQIGWKLARHQKIEALQWISLVLVLASGTATLVTHDPRFVMLKTTVIYLLVAWAMLQRGWMVRFMPAEAMEHVPDLAYGFGYVWAGMMFFTAALNVVLALRLDFLTWGAVMSIWASGSKIALFFLQYGIMKTIGRRRARATHQVLLQPAFTTE